MTSGAGTTRRGGRRAGAQRVRDHGAFRPAHVGHRESGHKTRPFMERLPWVDVLQVRDSVQEADPTVDQQAEGYAGAAAGATRGRMGGV